MESAFITGANKSTGFATARQLLQKGYHVYLGSRALENGLLGTFLTYVSPILMWSSLLAMAETGWYYFSYVTRKDVVILEV